MSSSSVWGGLLRLSWWGVLLRWQEGESVEEVLWVMTVIIIIYSFHDRIFRPIVNSSGAYLFSLFATSVSQLVTGPWSPFDYCHILEVFAVPVVTQPVLSAFVMAAALGLLRVRRAGGLRSDEPLEKTAHRLLCE